MIPARDGVGLSAYLYFPRGKGPWPVIYEQRYQSVRSDGARRAYARLAAGGYVVCIQNFRGAQLSQGEWTGYRSLGLGKLKDGYDAVEWLEATLMARLYASACPGTSNNRGGVWQIFLAR